MFIVNKKEDFPIVVIQSKTENNKHYLFLEWDNKQYANIEFQLSSHCLPGILIETKRGFHFISTYTYSFKEMIQMQEDMLCDPEWIKHNRERGVSALRISHKYKKDSLKVVPYIYTSEKLKKEYEKLVRRYQFYHITKNPILFIKTYFMSKQSKKLQGDLLFDIPYDKNQMIIADTVENDIANDKKVKQSIW